MGLMLKRIGFNGDGNQFCCDDFVIDKVSIRIERLKKILIILQEFSMTESVVREIIERAQSMKCFIELSKQFWVDLAVLAVDIESCRSLLDYMPSLYMFIGYTCDDYGDRSCNAKNWKIIQLIDVISNDDVFCEDMDKWTRKMDLAGSCEYVKISAEIVLEPLVEKVQREPYTPPIIMKRRTKVSRPAARYYFSRHYLWLAGIGDDYKVKSWVSGSLPWMMMRWDLNRHIGIKFFMIDLIEDGHVSRLHGYIVTGVKMLGINRRLMEGGWYFCGMRSPQVWFIIGSGVEDGNVWSQLGGEGETGITGDEDMKLGWASRDLAERLGVLAIRWVLFVRYFGLQNIEWHFNDPEGSDYEGMSEAEGKETKEEFEFRVKLQFWHPSKCCGGMLTRAKLLVKREDEAAMRVL
ncbi:hypothetical protein GIB67_010806 [Kingdonia uniflora]|uniref:Uncharacterized protein n=1 Tax=Kingdonia uniflora TaxID=39325 RepID=A0A7J7L958_9MAGN|nr:hypothetical protein GIB67_010806 [Kingdonia uniflora]